MGHVVVSSGATLTVAPGTVVRFKPYRAGMRPDLRLRLRVEGRLVAKGRSGAPIRFTTAHKEPLNGDWHGMELVDSQGSHITHALIEYAERGLRVWKSQATLEKVVIRFNNWQGISASAGSKLIVDSSRIYANGYLCVDLLGGSDLQLTNSFLARCRPLGLHVGGDSNARLEENLFEGGEEGLYISGESRVELTGNTFVGQRGCAFSCEGKVKLRRGGNAYLGRPEDQATCCDKGQMEEIKVEGGAAPVFSTGVEEGLSSYLDYIPGQIGHDPFPYILDGPSDSRVVDMRFGASPESAWSLAYDAPNIWVADTGGKVTRRDLASGGDYLASFKVPTSKPWGMAVFDGKLWINDYNLKEILVLDRNTGKLLARHPSPDPADGCRGMTQDGKQLYVLGHATPKVYVLDSKGAVTGHFPAPTVQLGPGLKVRARGALAWDGEAFWAPAGRLLRFDRTGKVSGWVHTTGATVRGLAWDGSQLWTVPRINYSWTEKPRFYRIKILKVLPIKTP